MKFTKEITGALAEDIAATRDADMTIDTAAVCLMTADLITRLADEVTHMFAALRIDATKPACRLIRTTLRVYEQATTYLLDAKHRAELAANTDTLIEENSTTLTQMYFCIKNELDKNSPSDLNEARAAAWRVVLLVDVLRSWCNTRIKGERRGVSDYMLNIERGCELLCGEPVTDTTRTKAIETAKQVFNNALKRVKVEVKK